MSRPMKAMERLHGIIYILLGTSLGARRAGRRRSLWTLCCATQRLLGSAQNTSRQSWLAGLQSCHSRLQRSYRLTGEQFKPFIHFNTFAIHDADTGGLRNHNLHIKNDTYSLGVSAELIMSHPSADTATTFPHNITKATPFSSVLIRERSRPDSSLTTAELYFVLAMAAKHRTLLDIRSINVGSCKYLLSTKLTRCSYAS